MIALALLLIALAAPGQDDPGFRSPAVVRGRFLRADGTPASGATLRLRGLEGDAQRRREFGLPRAWTHPTTEADDEGRAELRFVPPRAYSFSLEVELEGHARALWSWWELGLGEEIELGEIRLAAAGTIVGTVVDAEGNVLRRGWSGNAYPLSPADGQDMQGFSGAVAADSGEFRLEGVPCGRVGVRAQGLGVTTEAVEVDLVAGVEAVVEIVYDGPDLARRIVVRPRSPFWIPPEARDVLLIARDGTVRTAVAPAGANGSLVFDDVPEGTYRVAIESALYTRWSRDDVRPGDRLDAVLRPRASVKLDVVDAETGQALSRYGVGVVFHEAPNHYEYEQLADGSPRPPDGVLADLMPTAQTLVIRVPDRPERRVVLDGEWPDGARAVRVEIQAPRPLAGRVVDGGGRAMVGARVERTSGAYAGPPRDLGGFVERSHETDAAGRFTFDEAADGAHTFHVVCSPWLTSTATAWVPLPAGDELVVRVPAAGWLEGRVRLPEGATVRDLALDFAGAAIDDEGVPRDDRADGAGGLDSIWGRLAEDGSFRLGPLPAGELEVELVRRVPLSRSSQTLERDELGTVTVRAGETARAEWDLRDSFPGGARVRLRVLGGARGAALIVAHGAAPGELESFPAAPDDQGEIRLPGLAPGTWFLEAVGKDRSWGWTSDEALVIAPGRETRQELTVHLVPRRVRFVDAASGAPLAGRTIEVRPAASRRGAWSRRVDLDDAGTFELLLPSGMFRFRAADPPRAGSPGWVEVEWGAGGDVLEVKLAREERR